MLDLYGAPGEIRTPDRSVRSRVLYPAELRARCLANHYRFWFIFCQALVLLFNLAESEGFEPSMGDKAHTPLAGERLQPLGHFSNSLKISLLKQKYLTGTGT